MVQRADISQVLSQMRLVQQQMHRPVHEAVPGAIAPGQLARPQQVEGFGELFSRAIENVNSTQKQADGLRRSYEVGDPGVSLTQVMVAAEKSSVSFQAMVQVRNKLIEAYKDIMSMPV
jgi:flagellar hook-basal body complex protein FliE